MVPQGRIELPTSSLPRMRSTTELLRRYELITHKDGGSSILLWYSGKIKNRILICLFLEVWPNINL